MSASTVLWITWRHEYGLEMSNRYVVPNFSDGSQWASSPGAIGMFLLTVAGVVAVPLVMRLTRDPLSTQPPGRQEAELGNQGQ